jgi:hypothetical protein
MYDGQPRELPEHNWPQYLDQRIETNGTQTAVWTDSDEGFFPQFIPIDPQFNINQAESMKIELCQPVIIIEPTTDGGNDGVVKARAMGGHGHLFNYELTLQVSGTTLSNTTGIFTNVPSGLHSMKITETPVGTNPIGGEYFGNGDISVPVARIYGDRYTGIFQDEHGRPITVTIQRKGYTGVAEEICFAGTPLTLTTDVIGDDFIGGLVPTEMALNLLQTYDGQFDEMFMMDADAWRLYVLNSGLLTMTGTLFPDQTSIQHRDNPIYVQMVAYVGLTNLGDIKIDNWCGNISLLDAIVAIQAEYNMIQYELEEFTGLYESSDSSGYADSMLSHYIVNASMFNDKLPKDVILGILESFGFSITISEVGRLRVQLIANMTLYGSTGLQGSRYSNAGIYNTSFSADIGIIDIKGDKTGNAYYVDNAQRYGYLNNVSKLKIQNQVTELQPWDMSLDEQQWFLMKDFDGNGDISRFGDDDFLTLTGSWTGDLSSQVTRVKTSWSSFRIYGSKINIASRIDLFLVDIGGNDAEGSDVHNDIASVLFTVDDHASMTRETYLDQNIGEILNLKFNVTNEWSEITVENRTDNYTTPPGGYNIRMWVYGVARNNYNYEEGQNTWPNKIQFKGGEIKAVLPPEHDDLNSPFEIDNQEGGDDIGIIESMIGDAPYTVLDTFYSLNFGGILARDTMENTKLWISILDENALPLRELMAYNIMRLRDRDIKKLDGTLNAEYPRLGYLMYDSTIDGGYFMPQKFTYDVKFNKLGFSGIQINRASGFRLLEYLTEPNQRLLEPTGVDIGSRKLQ